MAIRSYQIRKRRPLQALAAAGEPDRRITDVSPQACAVPGASEVVVRLVTRDAGDGREHDFVTWQEPRLESPGHSPLFLHDLRGGVCQNPPRLPTRKDASRRRLSGPCISLAKTRSGMPPSRRV